MQDIVLQLWNPQDSKPQAVCQQHAPFLGHATSSLIIITVITSKFTTIIIIVITSTCTTNTIIITIAYYCPTVFKAVRTMISPRHLTRAGTRAPLIFPEISGEYADNNGLPRSLSAPGWERFICQHGVAKRPSSKPGDFPAL